MLRLVLAGTLDRCDAISPHPPQLIPVVGIVIDEQADARILLYVSEPAQVESRLRLVIDADDDPVRAVESKRARHNVRLAADIRCGQPKYRSSHEPVASLGDFQAHEEPSLAAA